MNKQIAAAFIATCGLAIASCQMPAKGPAADYQAPISRIAPPANLRSICYTQAEFSAFHARHVEQSIVVGVLECKSANGSRLYDQQWAAFVRKFDPELSANFREMQGVAARKRVNYDSMVTEIANRTAGRNAMDPAFCSRHGRALAWALSPQVTSLNQVPPPYDFSPEMNVFPCPGQ